VKPVSGVQVLSEEVAGETYLRCAYQLILIVLSEEIAGKTFSGVNVK